MEDEEKVSNAAIEKQTTEHKNLKKKNWYPQYYKHRPVILVY